MNNVLTHAAATPPEDSSIRLIPLTQGKSAIVDAEDFERLSQWKWFAHFDKKNGRWYAQRTAHGETQRTICMHRIITSAPTGSQVDHRNLDGLDNRRVNLRLASNSQNQCNRSTTKRNKSGYKGVHWDRKSNKWRAQIAIASTKKLLGFFRTKEAAAQAYRDAAVHLHGEFART